jgi:hypothetical protein
MSSAVPSVHDQIRAVLLNDWDPHNAVSNDAAHGTYDGYLEPLRRLIEGGAGEDVLVDWLQDKEQETMCFPSLGTRRLKRVAQKLMALQDGRAAV